MSEGKLALLVVSAELALAIHLDGGMDMSVVLTLMAGAVFYGLIILTALKEEREEGRERRNR